MPTYSIQGPDGKTYSIEGPVGATRAQVIAAVKARMPTFPPEEEEDISSLDYALGLPVETGKALLGGAAGLVESAATGASFLLPEEAEQAARARIAEIGGGVQEALAPAPAYEDSLYLDLVRGVGSTAPFIPAAFLGAPGVIAGAALGVGAGSGEAAQRAVAAGATEDEISTAAGLGMIPGAFEIFGPGRIAKRFEKVLGSQADEIGEEVSRTFLTRLYNKLGGSRKGRITQAAIDEGIQEAVSEVGQNLIQRGIYDPEQGVFTGTGESFGLGAGVGGFLQGLTELILPGRQRRAIKEAEETLETTEEAPETAEQAATAMAQVPVGESRDMFPDAPARQGPEPEQLMDVEDLAGVTAEDPIEVEIREQAETVVRNRYSDAPLSPDAFDAAVEAEADIIRNRETAASTPPTPETDLIDLAETQQVEALIAADEEAEKRKVAAERDAAITDFEEQRKKQERAQVLDEVLADESVVTSADVENRFAEEIVKRSKIYESETQPTVSEIAEAVRRKRPSPVVEPEVVADGSSVESLEAVIPERQPKPPPPAEPTEPDLQAQERSRLNRERLDRTGRLPRGTDPNEATGAQLEIPAVSREPVRAPATSLLPPAPDVGTAPQPGETGEQLTLPFGTGAGAGSTRVVTPRDFIAQETRKQEARPPTPPDTAPPEVEVASDIEAIQTVQRAPVVTGKTKYTPDGAAQYYVAAFGDDVDMMLRTIAYDTSTPMKGNVQTGFKKETGYVTDNKRGNAAAQWVRNNFSPTSISALEKHIREAQTTEFKSRTFLNRLDDMQKAQRQIDEYVNDGTKNLADALSQQAVNENKVDKEYLIKDAVSASMTLASDEVNTLALDGRTKEAINQVALDSPNLRVRTTARKIANALGNTKITFVEGLVDPLGRVAAAAYNRNTDTIELNLDVPLNIHALLHEGAHAATIQVLSNPSNPVTKKLTKLYNNLQGNVPNGYAMESLQDFVAEAFTNVNFQSQLAAFKPSGGKLTAWDRFWRALTDFLGFPSGTQTATEAARQYINTILATSPYTRTATEISNAAATDPDKAFNHAISGGVKWLSPSEKRGTWAAVVAGWNTYPAKAKASLFNGVGLEAIVDVGKEKLPNAERFQEVFYEIDGVRNNETIRFTDVFSAALKAFSGSSGELPNSQAIEILNELVALSTTNRVDPSISDAEKNKRYKSFIVRYGQNNTRKEEFFRSESQATQRQAALQSDPNVKGKIVLVSPLTETQDALRQAEALYRQLSPQQQDAYKKMRDEYFRLDSLTQEAQDANIEKLEVEDGIKKSIRDTLFQQRLEYGNIDPYFPLYRDGDYWLEFIYTDATGQVNYGTSAYKTVAEQGKALKLLQDQGIDVNVRSREDVQNTIKAGSYQGVPLPFLVDLQRQLNDVLKTIPTDNTTARTQVQEFMEQAILKALPEQSLVQARQARRGILGFNRNALEVFEKRMPQLITSYANVKYQVEKELAARGVEEDRRNLVEGKDVFYRDIADMLVGPTRGQKVFGLPSYLEFSNNPYLPEGVRFLRGLTFVGTLGFNISSVAVNTSIIPMVLQARLSGEYGATKALASTSKAIYLYGLTMGNREAEGLTGPESKIGGFSLTNETTDLDDRFKLFGPLKQRFKNLGFDTRTIAAESSELEASGFGWMRKLSYWSGFLFNHNERAIRQVSGMSTYMLEMEKLTGKKFSEITEQEVNQFGEQAATTATNTTLWVNSSALLTTGSRLSQQQIGSLAMQYKRVPMQFMYQQASMLNAVKKLTLNEAKTEQERAEAKALAKTLIWLTASGSLILGAQGIPLYGMLAQVMDWGLEEDEDDFDTMMAKKYGSGYYGWLATGDIYGFDSSVAKFLSPEVDLTQRINLTNLMVRDPGNYRQDKTASEIFTDQIAAYSVLSRSGRGLMDMFDGDPANNQRALEDMVPAAFSNVFKSMRIQSEGYRTRRGDAVLAEVGVGDAIYQGLGFTPFEYRLERDKLSLNLRKTRGTTNRRSALLDAYTFALGDRDTGRPRDTELLKETIEKIKEFNGDHPSRSITNDSLRASLRAKRANSGMAKITGGGPVDRREAIEIIQSNREFDEAFKE